MQPELLAMPRYAVKFSTLTGKTTVHSEKCTQARWREGYVVVLQDAETAEMCAAIFETHETLQKRGFPAPVICACARYMDEVRRQNAKKQSIS
jgi:hypothetical protein